MTTLTVFLGYLFVLLVVGEVFARLKVRSLDDYLLSGREHGTFVTSATIIATVLGAGSTIGAAGVAYYVGISAGWYLLSAAPGLVLLAYTLAPELRGLSVYTVPQYLERRFGPRAGILADVLGLVALALFLAAQLYAMGNLMATFTQLGATTALVLSAVVVIVYTWRGGNWAIHWSDTLQVALIVLGVGAAAWLTYQELGGLDALRSPPVVAGFGDAGERWFHPITENAVDPFAPLGLGNTVFAWIIMSTTWHFAMQSTAQRILSSRNQKVAVRSCLIAAVATVPLCAVFAFLGMGARVLFPELPAPEGMELAEQVRALPALVDQVLPPLAAGLVLAALVAVIMSTCDSALLGAATLWMKDLRPRIVAWKSGEPVDRPHVETEGADGGPPGDGAPETDEPDEAVEPAEADEDPDRSEIGETARGRRAVLVLGGVGLGFALVAPGLVQVLEMVAAVYCVALFVPLIAGYFWSGASEAGAIGAMVASGGIAVAWRGLGFEEQTGLHMLNLALPAAAVALFGLSLFGPFTESSKEIGE